MRVCLVSQDSSVKDLVEGVVGHSLVTVLPYGPIPEADVYIWDIAAELQLRSVSSPPISIPKAGRHLVLANPAEVATVTEHLMLDCDGVPACILLKPLRGPTLECFMGSMAQGADCASLLQYSLEADLKLQQHDQERTNFLARSLHDLRAPVTAIQGYCGLLLDAQYGELSAAQRDVMTRMLVSARRLARLSTGMFDFSIQGHVEQDLRLEQVDLEECLDQALHELSQYFEDKELLASIQLDPPGQPMLLETQRIEQLLINLVENACKFSPTRGEIVIRGYPRYWDPEDRHRDGDSWNAYQIDIQDSGPGIAPAALEVIFEGYCRSTGPDNRSGSGLGLAICKMIVEAHGGVIWAASESIGARFSLILPFAPNSMRQRMRDQTRHGVSPGPFSSGPFSPGKVEVV